MNKYLIFIIAILVGKYLLTQIVETLNVRHASPILPDEFKGFYDEQQYKKSQNYLKETTWFSLIKATIMIVLTLLFILCGGFNYIDSLARGFGLKPILTGLIFAGILMCISSLLGIPFSAYRTFVIEERYGFNKTTLKTFITDFIKSFIISTVIGGIIFGVVIWFFMSAGNYAWLYCWIGVTLFQVFLIFIAPVVIMPLFNKFIPLEDGELKAAIEEYAAKENFKMRGIFKIDASKRSTKSNAFFTGFGKYRRIALYDTLIQKHTVGELVSILAHEIGHYKKKHILKHMATAILASGGMFFILSFFIENPGLFAAFKMQETSIYASLIFFGFLYTPINMILSIVANVVSRKHEYEADRFAVETYKKPEAFILALKKLTVDNLSNLTPHPLKIFMNYSHPPVLQRIKRLRLPAVLTN